MKSMKMFIPIANEEKKVSLVNANKIKELEKYIPCEEALQIHMKMQKIELQKDENYKPKPLYISIERSIFNDIISKIEGKNKNTPKDHVPLVVQYPAIPICIIQPK